jgi:hypothetical protein
MKFDLLRRVAPLLIVSAGLTAGAVGSAHLLDGGGVARAQDEALDRRFRQGLAIAPVPLDLSGKSRTLVGLGSYIVNAQGGCNDCHTFPAFAEGGDPHQGEPEVINAAVYLAGGRPFGPGLVSPNITPDADGLPAGLTLDEFVELIRTGRDEDDPGHILQVMPWPVYSKMTDRDLRAVYEYLRAIPSLPDNAPAEG